ncbi:N-terminal Xaa-Pro-Lys N-methyltransferase 1-A [Atheta coriaria]|uniref:N-terminal Xaa-Pro-Lys N-methyltransferase 1-A n=1 Tax=Dalotia coriaria TaxID=877792 RepID=UPI0031F3E879
MFPEETVETNEISTENTESNEDFYKNAKDYWSHLPPTENTVLGGYGHISQIDIQGSRNFLHQIYTTDKQLTKDRALDCGAGIGRITRCLLTSFFQKVDLVEQNAEFLKEAKVELVNHTERIGEYYAVGLQDFQPEHKYDVIWCQWVLGHLIDEDLVKFFNRCKASLTEKGFLVVKENMSSSANIEMDSTDSSITRSYSHFMDIFKQAGLKCFKKQKQMHFPKDLYTVYMFALRPEV